MRRVGQTRRRDANEPAICQAIEAVGGFVTKISGKGAPDILVVYRRKLFAFEVKSGSGKQTAAQQATNWPLVRSVEEALRAIGAIIRTRHHE